MVDDTRLYKLTDQHGKTRGKYQWGWGVTHHASIPGKPYLCTGTVVHAYIDPQLGAFLNPIHANINNPIFWEAEGLVVVEDNEKVGCQSLTTWNTIDVALPNVVQQRAFAILSALSLNGKDFYHDSDWEKWERWALRWLSGEDRSEESRRTAYASASASAYAYAYASASASTSASASAYAYASASAYAYASAKPNGPKLAREAMAIT